MASRMPGAVLATRHLLELGHRDVPHIAGPLDWVDARLRLRGWQAERARWGLPPAEPIVADWSPDQGYAVARRLLAEATAGGPSLPTAILAANDQLALGALRVRPPRAHPARARRAFQHRPACALRRLPALRATPLMCPSTRRVNAHSMGAGDRRVQRRIRRIAQRASTSRACCPRCSWPARMPAA